MKNPIYLHPLLYETSLRILYRKHYMDRLTKVADCIPPGASVADVCAGDCALYRYALKEKTGSYLACDTNESFLRWNERRGIDTRRADVLHDEIPTADCVVMMGSLYQFIPNEESVMQKIIRAARKKAIVTEPVHNLAQSGNPFLKTLAVFLTSIGSQKFTERFTKETLTAFLSSMGFQTFTSIAGGREILACLEKNQQNLIPS